MFSEVCKAMIAHIMRLCFMLKRACYAEEKCQNVCCNCGKSCGVLLAQQGYPISINFQGNLWLYLNLNSLSWIVQPFAYEFRMQLQRHRKRQDTARVTLKLMKVIFPAHEVCTTPSMKKTETTSFTFCCRQISPPAKFHPPVVKSVVLKLFQGRF